MRGTGTYISLVEGVGKEDSVSSSCSLVGLILSDLLGALIVHFNTNDSNGRCQYSRIGVRDARQIPNESQLVTVRIKRKGHTAR